MYSDVVPKALQAYGLDCQKILPAQKGYRNESYPVVLKNGNLANLIFYKREPGILDRIKNANAVSEFVASNGLPARRQLDRRTLALSWDRKVVYIGLYDYLPGSTIPWEAYSQKHIKLLGKIMSDMHAALRSMPVRGLPGVSEEYAAIGARMIQYLSQSNVQKALAKKLNLKVDMFELKKLVGLIDKTKHLPSQQALHMDFVRSNILFEVEKGELAVSGILDFEKTATGHPIFDIARTLAFLLVDCKYKEQAKVRKYFLYSGYLRRGHSKLLNVKLKADGHQYDLREELIKFFLLHDFYKFLRHNPYEFLLQNEHFVRTRDILVQLNMINYV